MPDNPLLPATQLIRDMVADFIYPPGNVIAGLQGYPKHQAENIRAGKEDGNELVQLLARYALAVAGGRPATSGQAGGIEEQKPNCWICGEMGHHPAPQCLTTYAAKQRDWQS